MLKTNSIPFLKKKLLLERRFFMAHCGQRWISWRKILINQKKCYVKDFVKKKVNHIIYFINVSKKRVKKIFLFNLKDYV